MANLSEVTVVNSMEVFPCGQIVVSKTTTVYRDGVEIASETETPTINPGDDISGEDPKVQSMASAIWTDELIQKFKQDSAQTDSGV